MIMPASKQVEIDTLTTRINLADDSLQRFRAYLASPKFTGESELQGYISIQDVERRLSDIWRELHGINWEKPHYGAFCYLKIFVSNVLHQTKTPVY